MTAVPTMTRAAAALGASALRATVVMHPSPSPRQHFQPPSLHQCRFPCQILFERPCLRLRLILYNNNSNNNNSNNNNNNSSSSSSSGSEDDEPLTVIYAGAAPGTHTTFLMDLFPRLKFVLVDPAPFSPKLVESERLLLRQELFTDDVAREYAGQKVLFICDIRACDWSMQSEDEVSSQVWDDMAAQMGWHMILRPQKSMLKFRLRWEAGLTDYLAGNIYLPVWGPITTTEARLIPDGFDMCKWDNTKYEEQMFYFNTVTRVARYQHSLPVGLDSEGLDYCYDCRAEIDILDRYCREYLEMKDEADIKAKIVELSKKSSRECASNRTLLDPNSDPDVRRKGIKRLQFINGVPAYDKQLSQPATPVYDDRARNMLGKMGYKEGEDLGVKGQGIKEPIAESNQFRRRGIGFGSAWGGGKESGGEVGGGGGGAGEAGAAAAASDAAAAAAAAPGTTTHAATAEVINNATAAATDKASEAGGSGAAHSSPATKPAAAVATANSARVKRSNDDDNNDDNDDNDNDNGDDDDDGNDKGVGKFAAKEKRQKPCQD